MEFKETTMNQNEQMREALVSIKCKAEHEYKCTNSTGFSDIQAAAEQALAAEPDHIPDATKMVEPTEEMEWPDDAVRELLSKHAEPPFPDEAVAEFKVFLAEVDALRAALKTTQQLTFGAKIRKAKDVDGNSNVVLAADLADAHRTLAKWLNEEIEAPIDRVSLSKVLAATQCLAVKECVTAQPAPNIAGTSQNWAGMDGATAFQIIERHADGWADIGKMMHEWLTANKHKPAPLVRLTDEELKKMFGYEYAEDFYHANAIMDAMQEKNK